ncbi:MAG: lipopolysaccharide biosynthesis protein [Bacteroidales bacterium]|nr:lipopolysaccharide biosynthesis protein [Bacteroidales bacterium]
MAEGDLKQKTISGMIWSGIGRIGTVGISFISNIVLARLLMPDDFGCIGMLYVFIAISGIFVSGGLGQALIQKKEPTHIDYTTVFYWNLVMSVIFYLILFFCAPAIARFYDIPLLKDVLRVQSIVLLIQSFAIVQANQLQKQLRFKELSTRNIVSALAGMTVAIIMAFLGYGVWSLVASTLITALVSVALLWKMSTWRPTLEFSFQSLKELFSFGGLMLLSSLVETIYTNLQSLIIGKFYSAKDLGYFTQAKKLEEVPTNSLSAIVNEVSFPVFSALQDDKEKLLAGVRKNVKAITYLNFPLMVLLMVIAQPLIVFLYGAKWSQAAPFFQILCVSSMIYTLNTLNTNVIKSLGKSAIYFVVQLSKRLIGIGLIVAGFQFGIYGLLWAVTSVGYISFIINAIVNGKLIGYGILKQMKDVGLCYVGTAAIGLAVYFLGTLIPLHPYWVMFIQIILFVGLYWLFSIISKMEGYLTYKEILLSKFKK